MDQRKIGKFLKELRTEKKLTQEQMAEKFYVTNRSVSRWENGNNMPDLDILIEISDYFKVDLREILNGERNDFMNKEEKDTILKAIDYTNDKALKCNKRVRICNGIAMLLVAFNVLLKDSSLYTDIKAMPTILDITQGIAIGMLLVGLIMSSRYGASIRAFKKRLFKKEEKID